MAVFIHLVGLLDSGQPLAFSTSPTSLYLRHEAKEPKKKPSFFVSLWSLCFPLSSRHWRNMGYSLVLIILKGPIWDLEYFGGILFPLLYHQYLDPGFHIRAGCVLTSSCSHSIFRTCIDVAHSGLLKSDDEPIHSFILLFCFLVSFYLGWREFFLFASLRCWLC